MIRGIKVMPDFGSSGLWGLPDGVMIQFEDLKIPKSLIKRFDKWVDFYDLKCHKRPEYSMIPEQLDICNTEGRKLARIIKDLFPRRHVEYWAEFMRNGKIALSKETIE